MRRNVGSSGTRGWRRRESHRNVEQVSVNLPLSLGAIDIAVFEIRRRGHSMRRMPVCEEDTSVEVVVTHTMMKRLK